MTGTLDGSGSIGTCPVPSRVQMWIEQSLEWFADQFGREAMFRPVVVASSDLIPSPYSGTREEVEQLLDKVYDLMGVEAGGITLDLFGGDGPAPRTGRRAVGHYLERDGRPVVGLEIREASDPRQLIAIIAHELAHVRLLGEGRIIAVQRTGEQLTDLLTVFLGMGVFTTNAAVSFDEVKRGWSIMPTGYLDERTLNGSTNSGYRRLGYLTEPQFGYALACHAWLRGETEPAWARSVDPGPRTHLRQGLTHLTEHGTPHKLPTAGQRRQPAAAKDHMRFVTFKSEPTRIFRDWKQPSSTPDNM